MKIIYIQSQQPFQNLVQNADPVSEVLDEDALLDEKHYWLLEAKDMELTGPKFQAENFT